MNLKRSLSSEHPTARGPLQSRAVVSGSVVVLAPGALLALGVWIATQVGSWAWLSGSDYVPDFSDLQQITATADCIANDPKWTLNSESCDPQGRLYNYPTLWAHVFAAWGLGLENTRIVGQILTVILLLSVTAVGFMSRRAWTVEGGGGIRVVPALLWICACVSPPFWLAIDRGNSDVVILAVVVVAAALSVKSMPVVPGLLVAFAALLKIFACGSGLMLLAARRHRWLTIATGAAGSLVAFAYLLDELPLISTRTPRAHWMSFGILTLPLRYQEQLGPWLGTGRGVGIVSVVLFIAVLGSVVASLKLARIRSRVVALGESLTETPSASVLFLAGSGSFLGAYCVGTAYDYRLMFLALAVAGLLLGATRSRVVALSAAAVLVLLMWCSAQWHILGGLADWLWLVVAPALAVITGYVSLRLLRLSSGST